MTCPRCGREQPPGETGRFCVHCGRVLSGVRWVASTPDALRPREPAPVRLPYGGPPRYRQIPRWSLWPWATRPEPGSPDGPMAPRTAPDPQEALRAHAELLRQLALTTALLTGVAAAGEVFRYVLLLLTRDRALSGVALGWSDVLVTLFGLLAPVAAMATGAVFLRWLLAARTLAAEISGTRPWRSTRMLLLGCVLPPFTLTVPGATLAEIEHAAAGTDPATARRRPGRCSSGGQLGRRGGARPRHRRPRVLDEHPGPRGRRRAARAGRRRRRRDRLGDHPRRRAPHRAARARAAPRRALMDGAPGGRPDRAPATTPSGAAERRDPAGRRRRRRVRPAPGGISRATKSSTWNRLSPARRTMRSSVVIEATSSTCSLRYHCMNCSPR